MRALDIIEKKRDNEVLTDAEIGFMVNGYTKGDIPDYQMSAFCMAIYFRGMNEDESTSLAIHMLNSGDKLDLSSIPGVKVDKHSTGGVGDKTSLVLAPMVASLGIKFAKMSGRGLGHTGGTLDKLESIPGYNINIPLDQFIAQVKDINLALVGQSGNLTPADKKMYALRDVTGTVPSIPLIASSIMSKKLASGADAICLDVKVGSGAFMKTEEEATKLATLMVKIGTNCNRKMTAILTNMDEPLGLAVGNSLEVIEAINTLNGKGPKDLLDLCLEIGSYLVIDAKLANTKEEAKKLLEGKIASKEALDELAKLVKAQGGDASYVYDVDKFTKAQEIIPVISKSTGNISRIDALAIGHAAMIIGAGRAKLDDKIDHAVGIVLNKKVGDYVTSGEPLAYIHTNGKNNEEAYAKTIAAFTFSDSPVEPSLIIKVIR